jgi:threonyl-tRNA synthetase
VAVRVIPINSDHGGYSDRVVEKLVEHGIQADIDSRNITLSSRLKDATRIGVSYIALFGSNEADNSELLIRKPGFQTLGCLKLNDLVTFLNNEKENYQIEPF